MANEVTTRRVLYEIPGMKSATVRQAEFRGADGEALPMAIYSPTFPVADPPPAVVIVEGYADPGFSRLFGCRFMEMQWSISMAQLLAASGMAAITYANREPVADASAILDHVRTRADAVGADPERIGLWATSGHGPVALFALGRAECAVLSNPFTFDYDGATHVAEAAKMFRFAVPSMATLPAGKPIFVVRSGKDEMPGLNQSLDRFAMLALSANHPITLVNHPDAPHSYDLYHDSAETRAILRQALAFLRDQLHT